MSGPGNTPGSAPRNGDGSKPNGQPNGRSGGLSPALLLGGAVCVLALPSAVLAFSSGFDNRPASLSEHATMSTFTPATVDPRLARTITMHNIAKGQLFRFTPAGTENRPDRSVTVAVRVDAATARAISVHKPTGDLALASGGGSLRLSPSAYSLGVSRGYQTFAQGFAGSIESRRADLPDLGGFKLGASGAASEPSRFSTRIALDERERTGRAPRTLEGNGEQTVDVGGSYSVGRNFNVTAGVRYSQDRDRLLPLVDGRQDAQAVYVGTQFRF